MTKITTLLGIAVVTAVAAAIVVKLHYFPALKEVYFKPDFNHLQQVPSGFVALRPTHSVQTVGNVIRNLKERGSIVRAVGRDVTFRNLIAEAYGCKPGRVMLPADAPKGDFDFLVTTRTLPMEHLQAAIKKQFGYVARRETLVTNVLKLKVDNTSLPGLTVSPDDEEADIQYRDGRLYFKHKSLDLLLAGLEDGLARPVLNETGLTGRYDFSVVWNQDIRQAMNLGKFDLTGVQKVLNGLGLRLEPGTASLEMVVVNNAH